jgi:hypothetical protein
MRKFSIFFAISVHQNIGSGSGFRPDPNSPKSLDPDLNPDLMSTVPIPVPKDSIKNTVNSGNFVNFQTLIGFFLKKSFWYGRFFFFSVDVQNRGLGSGSL